MSALTFFYINIYVMCIISLGNKQYHYHVYIYTCVCILWFFYQSGNPFFLFLLCNLFCMPIVICLFFMLLLVGPKLVIKYYYYYYY